MKHFFWFVTCLLINSPHLLAQTGTLIGIITDQATASPLFSATVNVPTHSAGTISGFDGSYRIELPVGQQEIVFSYLGYTSDTKIIDIKAGENTLHVALQEEGTILQTATVTSGKFEKPLSEVTVSLEVVPTALLENTNTVNVKTVLEKVPGVSIIDGQPNIRGGSGYSYGAGSRVLLLVDDIPILQADAGFPNWADVPTENIAQIEVVKGAASALYGSSAMNGIINVRTAYAKSEPETKFSTFYTAFMKPQNKELAWWDSAPYQWGVSAVHRQKLKKFDLVFGGLYNNESGYVQTPSGSDFARYGRFNSNIRYRVSDRLNIGFATNYNRGENENYFFWNGINQLYVASPGTVSRAKRTRYNIDPFLNYYEKNGNRHRLLGRFHRIDNNLENNQSNASNLFYGEYQFQKKWQQNLTTTVGLVATGFNSTAELYGDTT
ncbi:MAG: TonB-dependent receptor plug domain-containing protein, partial [Bacteroidota bacterium]